MNIFRDPFLFVAFGFGSGLSPKAPGTMGTIVAIPLFILLSKLGLLVYVLIVIAAALLGIWVCGKASERLGVHDHGGIVWDEIVGYWITMIGMPISLSSIILGFVLFRFLDIFKPWPINYIDRHVQGGLGIMLDDIVAGVFAWIIMASVYALDILPIE